MTAVHPEKGRVQGVFPIFCPGQLRAHGPGKPFRHRQQPLLPPVAVGAVVIIQGQNRKQVDIFHIVRFFPHSGHKGLVIIGQPSALPGQKNVLVRNDGKIDLHALTGQISVIQIAEALRRVIQHLFIQGIVQLGEMALRKIQAVVVQLAQGIGLCQGFQTAKALPARKLILNVSLKILRKSAGQEVFRAQLRHGGQLPALAEGKFPVGQEQAAQKSGQQRPGRQNGKQDIFRF